MDETDAFNSIKDALLKNEQHLLLLRNISSSLSDNKNKLFNIHNQNFTDGTDNTENINNENIDLLCQQSFLEAMNIIVNLKRSNRDAFLLAKRIDEDMMAAKARAESKELLLQSLLYEKTHLTREIMLSQAYETKVRIIDDCFFVSIY